MREPKRIIILFGGDSSEKHVSTASAQNVAEHLPDAALFFIAPSGEIFECDRNEVLKHKNPFKMDFVPRTFRMRFGSLEAAVPHIKDDVLLLALHGVGFEDGQIQARLEKLNLAFTGSDANSSALAFDKKLSKQVATRIGVRTARDTELKTKNETEAANILSRSLDDFGRIVLKPIADGSSVGLHILDQNSDLKNLAANLAKDGRPYLIEEFASGTELTVGAIEEGACQALVPSEVKLQKGANFSYDAKYLGVGAEELTPARVSPEITKEAQSIAVKMHQALGCSGYSRTDLIVSDKGIVYLETNTLPGMTKASFLPQQLAATNRDLRTFFRKQCELAWKRRSSNV